MSRICYPCTAYRTEVNGRIELLRTTGFYLAANRRVESAECPRESEREGRTRLKGIDEDDTDARLVFKEGHSI